MKQPVILIPGLLCDAALWGPQVAALAAIADVWIPELRSQSTMRAMGEAVLHEAPFQSFALAGLSMGGYVALEVIQQQPDRVTKLALLDTRARPEQPDETVRRRELMRLAENERGFTPVTNRMLPFLVHPSRVKDAPVVRTIRDMAERVGLDTYIRQQEAIISRPDFRPVLPEINCPTLVLCGREDQLTPLENSEEMTRAIPGATLVIVEQCGHLSTLERPAEVNAAMKEWLEASDKH
jgi:pimeloyl-ACP methyl ester carboxylesterase